MQSLLQTIYTSCQIRDGDLDTFFAYENQATPLTLSLGSDLLHCLELHEKQLLQSSDVDAIFLDNAAVVHMMHPGTTRTFFLNRQLQWEMVRVYM